MTCLKGKNSFQTADDFFFIRFDSLRPSQQFFSHHGTVFQGRTSTKQRMQCLSADNDSLIDDCCYLISSELKHNLSYEVTSGSVIMH